MGGERGIPGWQRSLITVSLLKSIRVLPPVHGEDVANEGIGEQQSAER